MKSKLFGCLSAVVLGAALALPTPAIARGGFGGGGMHSGGGFGGGGMHFGGGGTHFGGPMFMGRSISVPGGNRFAHAPFAGRRVFGNRFNDRFEDRFEHHHRFRNFAFFGAPFAYDYAAYGNGCWRWDGWQWINACYDYNY